MSFGKPRNPAYVMTDITQLKRDVKLLYGLSRVTSAPTQVVLPFFTGIHPASAPTGFTSLNKAGDTMQGMFAFQQIRDAANIYVNGNTLDLSQSTGAYTTFFTFFPGVGVLIKTILGASPGRIIFLQAAGGPFTIDNTGNISPINATASYSWGDQDIIILIYDANISRWVQVTAATGPSSGANTSLSNLTNPTSINQNLLPQASKTVGDATHLWLAMYSSQYFVGNTTTHTELDGSGNWIFTATGGKAIKMVIGGATFMQMNVVGGFMEVVNGAGFSVTPTSGSPLQLIHLAGVGTPGEITCSDGIQLDNAVNLPYKLQNGPYTLNDNDHTIACSIPSTITFPLANANRKGRRYVVIAAGGTVTVTRSGADVFEGPTYNGVTSVAFGTPGFQVLHFVGNGSGVWVEICRDF